MLLDSIGWVVKTSGIYSPLLHFFHQLFWKPGPARTVFLMFTMPFQALFESCVFRHCILYVPGFVYCVHIQNLWFYMISPDRIENVINNILGDASVEEM
jgi:hypothetical protein